MAAKEKKEEGVVTQEQLQGLIENQAKLEKNQKALEKENAELKGLASEGAVKKVKEVTERFANLRAIDDQIVVGFKNKGSERRPRYVYTKPNPLDPSKSVNFIDLILEDKSVVTVQHNEFLEDSERIRAQIINVKETPWVVNQGSTRRREVDGYSLIEHDFVVDLEVKGITRTYTLRLPQDKGLDGREVEVFEDYINM